jgi:predicted small metal-binding protein
MYQFVCSHIYPDCSHVHRSETREEALREAEEHLRGHHQVEAFDEATMKLVDLALVETRF